MSQEFDTQRLGWPDRGELFAPTGGARRQLVEFADSRIGIPLRRHGAEVNVGVLPSALTSDSAESPLAIVCEFQQPPTDEQLSEAHRLAWNLCRTRLLVTVERHRLRAWTCCLPPDDPNRQVFDGPEPSVSDTALHALHWLSLATGEFFNRRQESFRPDGRADAWLLRNLRDVRNMLLGAELAKEVCHDLIARLVFVQFLFQRVDSSGRPFIDSRLLEQRFGGSLNNEHSSLASILCDKEDTYRLFRWLNEKFNGDLFPGKGNTEADREREWRKEQEQVEDQHLRLLAGFVSGEQELKKGQRTLWPLYSFDTIPLEFISSVYEQFVSEDAHKNKAYYTRPHLVDYMLDNVLPWDSDQWNLKILDPCCGSGIFLVKAFQRLIHRWKNANSGRSPAVPDLKPILTNNLFGVDVDREAIRVASFSLYLAMCDAIDPRHYWKQTVLPPLRGRNLVHADFFREDIEGIQTEENAERYDLVVGNAPWGKNTIKKESPAKKWSANQKWPITYNDVGPLFLAKAGRLAKEDAYVSMIQPLDSLLLNRSGPAETQRKKLFSEFRVCEVTNLAALRFVLFENAVKGPCVFTFQKRSPQDHDIIVYIAPKESKSAEDTFRVVIEPNDIHEFQQQDALRHPHIWTTLAWGTWRDVEFIDRISQSDSLAKLKARGVAATREGIIRGNRKKQILELLGRRILSAKSFDDDVFQFLNADDLPVNEDDRLDGAASTDFSAFDLPQMIIKQSWLTGPGRFRAAMIDSTPEIGGILCSDSYVSVCALDGNSDLLETICLVFNSSFATYYQLLTSGQFAAFVPKPIEKELRAVPLPKVQANVLEDVDTFEEIDSRVLDLFGFKPVERILIEDLFQFTLPDFKGDAESPGRLPTPRGGGRDPDLRAYAGQVMRVLKAGFGSDRQVAVTIFQESDSNRLPARMLAIHLHWPERRKPVELEAIASTGLAERLTGVYQNLMKANGTDGFLFERHARLYVEHPTGNGPVPTVLIIKPDLRRHWTRSQALRDGDEIAAEILRMKWGESSE
ncbi:MAG: N-6 DNA methylase [Planctomycetaceae bacterium]|nr:N-6 DNA methylase [Planctomycetaceae bacterium]